MRQLTIFPRGGKRRRAGRKPRGEQALVSHARRPRIARACPMHVTTRLADGLPSLRTPDAFAAVQRALSSPREVRRALVYALQNARKHDDLAPVADRCSSARWFDGWEAPPALDPVAQGDRPVATARTWLLRLGWRAHGEIDLLERPVSPRPARSRSTSTPARGREMSAESIQGAESKARRGVAVGLLARAPSA